MRSGILSDGFIQSHNPAFFTDHTPRRKRAPPRTRIIKRAVIPCYDLYAVARETMENPFDGARELILNYRPGAPAPPRAGGAACSARRSGGERRGPRDRRGACDSNAQSRRIMALQNGAL